MTAIQTKGDSAKINSSRPKFAPPSVAADGETCCRLFDTLQIWDISSLKIWLENCIPDLNMDTNMTVRQIIYLQAPIICFASIHHNQCNHKCLTCCKHIQQAQPPTHYIPHHSVISPPPQVAINMGKSKYVHPVLPTFLQPLALSSDVGSSPRMWKSILACDFFTVTHIINRK